MVEDWEQHGVLSNGLSSPGFSIGLLSFSVQKCPHELSPQDLPSWPVPPFQCTCPPSEIQTWIWNLWHRWVSRKRVWVSPSCALKFVLQKMEGSNLSECEEFCACLLLPIKGNCRDAENQSSSSCVTWVVLVPPQQNDQPPYIQIWPDPTQRAVFEFWGAPEVDSQRTSCFFPGSFSCIWKITTILQPPVREKQRTVFSSFDSNKICDRSMKKKRQARKFFSHTLTDLQQKECVAHYRETIRRGKGKLGLSEPVVEGTSLYLCLYGKQEGPLKAARYSMAVGVSVLAAREWYTSVPLASSSILLHARTTPVLISAHTCPY